MAIRGTQSVQQGWNQATAATQAIMATGIGVTRSSPKPRNAGAGPRRARTVRAPFRGRREPPRSRTRAKAARSSRKPARLVKGSAAAKRYMAKLRAMVGKRRR